MKCYLNSRNALLKFGLLSLVIAGGSFTKLTAQVEGQYDTLNITVIDTSLAKEFVSYYEPCEIVRYDDMVIDLNANLEIPELLIGDKYTTTITYTNPFNFDIIVNKQAQGPVAGCGCVQTTYTNVVVPPGGQVSIQIDIVPVVAGNKSTIVELPILKKSPVNGNPATIVGIQPFKINFIAKQ